MDQWGRGASQGYGGYSGQDAGYGGGQMQGGRPPYEDQRATGSYGGEQGGPNLQLQQLLFQQLQQGTAQPSDRGSQDRGRDDRYGGGDPRMAYESSGRGYQGDSAGYGADPYAHMGGGQGGIPGGAGAPGGSYGREAYGQSGYQDDPREQIRQKQERLRQQREQEAQRHALLSHEPQKMMQGLDRVGEIEDRARKLHEMQEMMRHQRSGGPPGGPPMHNVRDQMPPRDQGHGGHHGNFPGSKAPGPPSSMSSPDPRSFGGPGPGMDAFGGPPHPTHPAPPPPNFPHHGFPPGGPPQQQAQAKPDRNRSNKPQQQPHHAPPPPSMDQRGQRGGYDQSQRFQKGKGGGGGGGGGGKGPDGPHDQLMSPRQNQGGRARDQPPRDTPNRDRHGGGGGRQGGGRDPEVGRAPPPRNLSDSNASTVTPRARDKSEEKHKYQVRVTPFPFTTETRDYQDLRLRYPRLHVAPEFQKCVCRWPGAQGVWSDGAQITLEHSATFFSGNKKDSQILRRVIPEPPKPVAIPAAAAPMKFNAKVVMLQGLQDGWWTSPDTHLSKLLKFLLVKSTKFGLMCMGGVWNAEKDGGGPGAPDDAALIRTAVRCVKEAVDVDLSGVTTWHPFMEIHYHRPAEVYKGKWFPDQQERTTFFVPDCTPVMPTPEQYQAVIDAVKKEVDDAAMAAWQADMDERRRVAEEAARKRAAAAAAAAEAAKLAAAAAAAAEAAKAAMAEAEAAESSIEGGSKAVEKTEPEKPPPVKAEAPAQAVAAEPAPAEAPKAPEAEGGGPAKPKEEVKEEPKGPPPPEPIKMDNPAEPAIVLRPRWEAAGDGKGQLKCVLISLDGLLDYNLEDVMEKNFEVSLFAELFHEMLQHRSAHVILTALQKIKAKADEEEKEAALSTEHAAKRKAETAAAAEGSNKQQKTAEGASASAGDGAAAKEGGEESGEGGKAAEGGGEEQPLGEEFEMVDKSEATKEDHFHEEEVEDWDQRRAWQYFDKGFAEHLRPDDAEVLIHNLGRFLSCKQVESLVAGVVSSRRVNYRKLTLQKKLVWDGTKDVVQKPPPEAPAEAPAPEPAAAAEDAMETEEATQRAAAAAAPAAEKPEAAEPMATDAAPPPAAAAPAEPTPAEGEAGAKAGADSAAEAEEGGEAGEAAAQ